MAIPHVLSQEKRNQRIGVAVSVGLHALLLLLFLLAIAWRAPDPPLPVFGVELNLGFEEVGSGDVAPSQAAEPTPMETPTAVEEPTPETNPAPAQDKVQTQPDESPEVIEEKPKTEIPVKKEEEKKETTPEKKVEKKPTVPIMTYPGSTQQTSQSGKGEGDDKDKAGDKGKPEGDPRAQYYTGPAGGGGGDGAALDLNGWMWYSKPNPPDNTNESGKVVLQIIVDDEGEILDVMVKERTVSADVALIYKREVQKLKFRKTNEQATMPSRSVGTITFIIRSR
jgi:outer membrane biosynthesis protein TonB